MSVMQQKMQQQNKKGCGYLKLKSPQTQTEAFTIQSMMNGAKVNIFSVFQSTNDRYLKHVYITVKPFKEDRGYK